jgi:hypothetical protein
MNRKANTQSLTVEDLDAQIQALNEERDEYNAKTKVKLLELTERRDHLAALESAKAKLETLSDTEKAALAQVIQAQGIPSSTEFGKIGKVS